MKPDAHEVADAIVEDWLKRLPSLDELATSDEPLVRDDFVVPAIHLQIVIQVFLLRAAQLDRARIVFGHDIYRLATPTEFSRAAAIRAFATNVVDSILCSPEGVTRAQLITSVVARVGMLPLAPVAQEAS